jgi:hypothetical protein
LKLKDFKRNLNLGSGWDWGVLDDRIIVCYMGLL